MLFSFAGILFVFLLIVLQATLLLPDPINNDVKFQGVSQPFFVFGILATAS
jgi:chlorophyll synthase